MSFKRFIFSSTFVKHLLAAILVLLILVIVAMQLLKIYTHHGESYPVPSFISLNVAEASNLAKENGFRYEIIDSVYVDGFEPGAVVEQVPKASAQVKKGRKILLTINSIQPQQVKIPTITDVSFRQAQVIIENNGLRIGNISFEYSQYNELVLDVLLNGRSLANGTMVDKGSKVDIVVGRSGNSIVTKVPNLLGITEIEAEKLISSAMLNVGQIQYDNTVNSQQDKVSSRVYKYSINGEAMNRNYSVSAGEKVDIWLTKNQDRVEQAITNSEIVD